MSTGAGTSNGLPYTYAVVPTLTSISPTQGPTTGGTTVTLTGTNFTGAKPAIISNFPSGRRATKQGGVDTVP